MAEMIADGEIAALPVSRPRGMARVTPYLQPILLAVIALPFTAYALWYGVSWLDVRFPGFLLMENAVVPTVSGFQWPPDKAAVFHAQVVAVDGQAITRSREVFDHLAQRPVGSTVEYTLLKDGQTTVVSLPIRRFTLADLLQTYGILFLFGCSNLVIGLTVGFLQPRTLQARVFSFHTFVAATYAISSVFLHHPAFHLLSRLCLLIECMVSATFIHLALTFPVVRGSKPLRRAILLSAYGLSLIAFLLALLGFDERPADLRGLHFAYSLTALGLVSVASSMAYSYWENSEPRVRLQIKAVLPGVLLACAVPCLVFVNNAGAGRDVPMQSGLLAALPFYASIAYAIGKHDLFDIDRVVRLSFVYALVSVVVLAGYAAVLQLGTWLFPAAAEHNAIIGALFVLVLAAAFDPLRNAAQVLVDRAFYRARLDYRATIRELSQVMTTLLDLHQVATQITQRVASAMQLQSIGLALVGHSGRPSTLWHSAADGSVREEIAEEIPLLARTLQAHPRQVDAAGLPALAGDETQHQAIVTLLARTGSAAAIPLMFRGQATGVLLLGPKQSGLPFDSEALDLLRTLANQTAIAVENARSYEALAELNRSLDAQVRERTEELRSSNTQLSRAYEDLKNAQAQLVQSEKMASLGQLVAGVAHELNNPASFVHGGLANLAEYLDRFVQVLTAYEQAPLADADRQAAIAELRKRLRLDYLLRETPELLRVCFEGSERITKIVEDLRVFARADSGQRLPTTVSEGLDSALRLLGSRLQASAVDVERHYEQVPQIDADSGQLNQVWMNLLSNALDAVAGRPNPRIEVCVRRSQDAKAIEVEVRDNGGGMTPEVAARIFEPFYTTKPIGKGTGLGLSIAYGAVKSHGGSIAVNSEPDSGTAIVVRLPGSRADA